MYQAAHDELTIWLGVDACNTTLEVLLFAAAMNLGQGWLTILTLFGGKTDTLTSCTPQGSEHGRR